MAKLRIQGLVKHANMVREELASPLDNHRLAQLESEVKRCLQTLEKIFRENNVTSNHLPAQSKKAYDFLASIDFNSIQTDENASKRNFRPASVTLPGIKRYFDNILKRLATETKQHQRQARYNSIVTSSEHIEKLISSEGIEPEHLTRTSKNIRGWLGYFSQKENFDQYTQSILKAGQIFENYHSNDKQIIVHFRPLKALYNTRYYKNAIVIKLPTAMITFDKKEFTLVAQMIFNKKNNKNRLLETIQSQKYQAVLQDMELHSGVIERSKGIYFDLDKSFNRVNKKYFNANIGKPKLVWSRTFNCRKFGHYEHSHDIVMVNSTLDHSDVHQYTVDFIVYHELLHKKLGIKQKGTRIVSHDAEFRKQERQFEKYNKARKQLTALAKR